MVILLLAKLGVLLRFIARWALSIRPLGGLLQFYLAMY